MDGRFVYFVRVFDVVGSIVGSTER